MAEDNNNIIHLTINYGKNKITGIEIPNKEELTKEDRQKMYHRIYKRIEYANLTEEKKEQRKEKRVEYLKKHGEKYNESRKKVLQCEICGGKYQVCNLSHHSRSKKHIKELNKN